MPEASTLLNRLYRLEKRGPHWGLSGIRTLLSWCGNPQRDFPSVLIGGTNGKGSTAAALERMLRESGLRTGLYTSPHLVRFHERIRVNGHTISGPRLEELLRKFVPYAERRGHSFFEAVTAMAFQHFYEKGVDLAVLEVGLGGRLDSTNIVEPEVSVLTGVSLEHMEYLGDTIEKIAREKAGISRKDRVTVVGGRGPARQALERAANKRGARVVRAQSVAGLRVQAMTLEQGMTLSQRGAGRELYTALIGAHQVSNLECALVAARALAERGFPVSDASIRAGLAAARWPARFQWVPGLRAVLDVAHNPEAARAFTKTYVQVLRKPGVAILGMLADKDAAGVGRALRRATRLVVATSPATPRALPADRLALALGSLPNVVEPRVSSAIRRALAERRPGEPLIVIGSLYTVGEAIPLLGQHVPTAL